MYTIFERNGTLTEPLSSNAIEYTEYLESNYTILFEGTKKQCLQFIDEL